MRTLTVPRMFNSSEITVHLVTVVKSGVEKTFVVITGAGHPATINNSEPDRNEKFFSELKSKLRKMDFLLTEVHTTSLTVDEKKKIGDAILVIPALDKTSEYELVSSYAGSYHFIGCLVQEKKVYAVNFERKEAGESNGGKFVILPKPASFDEDDEKAWDKAIQEDDGFTPVSKPVINKDSKGNTGDSPRKLTQPIAKEGAGVAVASALMLAAASPSILKGRDFQDRYQSKTFSDDSTADNGFDQGSLQDGRNTKPKGDPFISTEGSGIINL